MLTFGVTVLPDPPFSRFFELMEQTEHHGFEYGWTYDSHILWQESYATLPVAAERTSKLKLGHFVTNPGIRDPTVTASWYATMHDLSRAAWSWASAAATRHGGLSASSRSRWPSSRRAAE